jgi:3-isopropylmalate/(R)-2-methylmalate dehydratase small subunit
LSKDKVQYLFDLAKKDDPVVDISLANQAISISEKTISFDIDLTRKKMLVEGIDEIGYTLSFDDKISNYEKASKDADYNKFMVKN